VCFVCVYTYIYMYVMCVCVSHMLSRGVCCVGVSRDVARCGR
jgi:hypothetical protein